MGGIREFDRRCVAQGVRAARLRAKESFSIFDGDDISCRNEFRPIPIQLGIPRWNRPLAKRTTSTESTKKSAMLIVVWQSLFRQKW